MFRCQSPARQIATISCVHQPATISCARCRDGSVMEHRIPFSLRATRKWVACQRGIRLAASYLRL